MIDTPEIHFQIDKQKKQQQHAYIQRLIKHQLITERTKLV